MSFEDCEEAPRHHLGEALDLLSVSELEQRVQAWNPKLNAPGPPFNQSVRRRALRTRFSAPETGKPGIVHRRRGVKVW